MKKMKYLFIVFSMLISLVLISCVSKPRETINYNVNFDTNGGTTIESIIVEKDKFVIQPANPEKVGYIFDGWYSDSELTTKYNFDTLVTKNITLYAKWDINTYTVTFNSNDGSSVASQTVNYNTKATTPTSPSKTGYSFVGWYSDSELTTEYNFDTLVTENITLYAKWDITLHHNYYNECHARLPLLRQSNVHMYNNYYYKCSTAQDIRANSFAYSEYNYFEKCNTPQKISTGSYTGTKIKSFNDYLTGSGSSQATVVSSRTESISGGACMPDGSTNYNNWDTNSTLFYYKDGRSDVQVLNEVMDVASVVTEYAGAMKAKEKYSSLLIPQVTYTVTYNTNGGSAISEKNIKEGASLPMVTTTKAGYSLEGWYLDSGLTSKVPSNYKVTENVTLYAKWVEAQTQDSQILTFNSGSTGDNSFFTVSGNTKVGIGPKTYNGVTYTSALKMESATTIQFTLIAEATLTIVTDTTSGTIKINGTNYTTDENGVVVVNVSAGSYEIKKGASLNVYCIIIS